MAQFDSLIIFPLLWSSLFILILHYSLSIKILIPSFFSVKKFREKKLDSPIFYGFLRKTNKIKTNHSYNV